MKYLIAVFIAISLAACASSSPPRCSGTARHVNQPGVPVATAAVLCPASRSA